METIISGMFGWLFKIGAKVAVTKGVEAVVEKVVERPTTEPVIDMKPLAVPEQPILDVSPQTVETLTVTLEEQLGVDPLSPQVLDTLDHLARVERRLQVDDLETLEPK